MACECTASLLLQRLNIHPTAIRILNMAEFSDILPLGAYLPLGLHTNLPNVFIWVQAHSTT